MKKINQAVIVLLSCSIMGLAPISASASHYSQSIPKAFRHKWYGDTHKIYNRFTAKHEYYRAPGYRYTSKITRVKVYSSKHIRVWTNNQVPVTFKIKGPSLGVYSHGSWVDWSRY